MADDPDEELFAGVAVEEAAVGGFCAFWADALMSTGAMGVGGRARRRAVRVRVRVRAQSLDEVSRVCRARGAGRISDSSAGRSVCY